MRFSRLFLVLMIFYLQVSAQEIAIGQWRDHLVYKKGTSVTLAGDKAYCAADGGLFSVYLPEAKIERLSKIEGFSDVGAFKTGWSEEAKTLIIAYQNTNLDLLYNNTIYNLPDIRNKQFFGDKVVNKLYVNGRFAWVCCGFGIVKVDLINREIKETYYLGPLGNLPVQDIVLLDNTFYAATESGVYTASASNPFLSDPLNWTLQTGVPVTFYNTIASFNGKVFVNQVIPPDFGMVWVFDPGTASWSKRDSAINFSCRDLSSNSTYLSIAYGSNAAFYDVNGQLADVKGPYGAGSQPQEVFLSEDNQIWIADGNNTLVNTKVQSSQLQIFQPTGPGSNNIYDLSYRDGTVYVAPGDVDQWQKLYRLDDISYFRENQWSTISGFGLYEATGGSDFLAVLPDPEDETHQYVCAYGAGIISVRNGAAEMLINNRNSSLDSAAGFSFVATTAIAFDNQKNLWVSNSSGGHGISVYDNKNKTWDKFFTQTIIGNSRLSKIVVGLLGQKWILLPDGGGLLVLDDKGTLSNKSDDAYRKIGFGPGNGNLSGSDALCHTEDKDGVIWVGTNAGISVFYSPGTVFNELNWEAQQILIEQGGYVENLLENEIVTCIAVDGANRKWIGTQTSGVYLISADGTKELLHFNELNSPLFNNHIRAITINGENGEVFIATTRGLISYKYTATEPLEEFDDVYAYPNPVNSSYTGPVAIRGLIRDCDVRICDVAGNLVYKTASFGGQAIWDGKTLEGKDVVSGVYLVYCSNPDGSQRLASKIMMYRE